MKKNNLFIVIIMTISTSLLSSCEGDPEAIIDAEKTSYFSGDTIVLRDASVNASSIEWTIPDGRTFDDPTFRYRTFWYNATETMTITLEAFNGDKSESDVTSIDIDIEIGAGNVVFWKENGSNLGDITVTMEGPDYNSSDMVDQELNSKPECANNSSGAANFVDLPVAGYDYVATNGTEEWRGNFFVKRDTCIAVKLE